MSSENEELIQPQRARLPDDLRVERLYPELAEALRHICTHLGFPERCIYAACVARKRCSTKQVMCWQVAREHVNPMIQRALAVKWAKDVANGTAREIAPVKVADYTRILERIKQRSTKRHRSRKKRAADVGSEP